MNLKKRLITLSGEDYGIVSECDRKLQTRFVLIGLFVLIIFALCFVSSYFSFTQLFPNYFVGIPVALFFAWMITNLYLLLLYTFSKNVLPQADGGNRTKILSVGLRLAFVCFIAIVISKPLEAWLFSSTLNSELAEYKREKIEKFTSDTSEFFSRETSELNSLIETQEKLYGDADAAERVEKYRLLIEKKQRQKESLIVQMQTRVNNSNFFLQSLVTLNSKYPACWLLSLLGVIIFLTPALIKKILPEKSNFYDLKKQIEMKLVQEEYAGFKTQYDQILRDKHQSDKTRVDFFADAPFNTVSKSDRIKFLTEDDLIAELYDA